MCALAHYFESEGLATVLVGFVREHIHAIKPPRALWLDFPMGRPLGKPNDSEFQTNVIRAAFKLFDAPSGPALDNFPESVPVDQGRMSYALPPELVSSINEIEDVDALVSEVEAELEQLRPAWEAAVTERGRTTVGASEVSISDLVPYLASFVRGEEPTIKRAGLHAIALLKLVVEDLNAYYTETWSHRDGIYDFELLGKLFWQDSKAGELVRWLEAVALSSDDKVLKQIVDMALVTPRFWSQA